MKKVILNSLVICLSLFVSVVKSSPFTYALPYADTLPVRGFAIAAPQPKQVDSFVTFIKDELVPRQVNTIVLRVDYNYKYKSHPELVGDNPLSEKDVKKIVAACKPAGINIIPQINLLGH